jgi:hypothetical protein
VAKILYCDGPQFADVKDREQPLPPTAAVRFGSETGAAKDRSPVANIDPDRALISFKEVPKQVRFSVDGSGCFGMYFFFS